MHYQAKPNTYAATHFAPAGALAEDLLDDLALAVAVDRPARLRQRRRVEAACICTYIHVSTPSTASESATIALEWAAYMCRRNAASDVPTGGRAHSNIPRDARWEHTQPALFRSHEAQHTHTIYTCTAALSCYYAPGFSSRSRWMSCCSSSLSVAIFCLEVLGLYWIIGHISRSVS